MHAQTKNPFERQLTSSTQTISGNVCLWTLMEKSCCILSITRNERTCWSLHHFWHPWQCRSLLCRPSTGPLTDTNFWRLRLADLQLQRLSQRQFPYSSFWGHNHWSCYDWVRRLHGHAAVQWGIRIFCWRLALDCPLHWLDGKVDQWTSLLKQQQVLLRSNTLRELTARQNSFFYSGVFFSWPGIWPTLAYWNVCFATAAAPPIAPSSPHDPCLSLI